MSNDTPDSGSCWNPTGGGLTAGLAAFASTPMPGGSALTNGCLGSEGIGCRRAAPPCCLAVYHYSNAALPLAGSTAATTIPAINAKHLAATPDKACGSLRARAWTRLRTARHVHRPSIARTDWTPSRFTRPGKPGWPTREVVATAEAARGGVHEATPLLC